MAPIAILLNFAIAGTSGYSLYHSLQCIRVPHLRNPDSGHQAKAQKAAAGRNTVGAGTAMVSYSPCYLP